MAEPIPQFGTAEYAGKPGSNRCGSCGHPIGDKYYKVNGTMTCPGCAEQARLTQPGDSREKLVRAVLFGIGGALLGLAIYAAFGIATGWMIGYVSLAVGYIVGKAIMMGTRGFGARRYQIIAALLTYGAVSVAAIPIAIVQYAKEGKPSATVVRPDQGGSAAEIPAASAHPAEAEDGSASEFAGGGFLAACGALLLIGLASPFLELQEPMSGLIGLVILFVGIQIAWKSTAGKPTTILGPFDNVTSS